MYRNQDGRFARPVELAAEGEDILTTPLLEGLDHPLRRIFAGASDFGGEA